jgi:hypothetical protein
MSVCRRGAEVVPSAMFERSPEPSFVTSVEAYRANTARS